MSQTKGAKMSDTYQSLAHSKWDCKYHVVFIRKGRQKVLYGQLRKHLGKIFHDLAHQKECQIIGMFHIPVNSCCGHEKIWTPTKYIKKAALAQK